MFISNVGDSRAILISEVGEKKMRALALSNDQTPYRRDERIRVRKCGARILTMDQIEGYKPMGEWGEGEGEGDEERNAVEDIELGKEIDEEGDPPRVWASKGTYPGTAFTRSTKNKYIRPLMLNLLVLLCIRNSFLFYVSDCVFYRSIGDGVAKAVGVIAEPEIYVRSISKSDRYVVIATDGIWEFITNDQVAEIAETKKDPIAICQALTSMAYELWLDHELRTDDITIIVIALQHIETSRFPTQSPSTGMSGQIPLEWQYVPSRPVRVGKHGRIGLHMHMQKSMSFNDAHSQEATCGHESTFVDTHESSTSTSTSVIDDPKIAEESLKLTDALRHHFVFSHLENKTIEELLKRMKKLVFKQGEVVVSQGDKGDSLYVISQGTFEVRVLPDGACNSGDSVVVQRLDPNGSQVKHLPSFGEMSLM